MSLSNLFENRAYITNLNTSTENSEIELVGKILSSLKNPIHAENIKLVSINDDHDIYKFDFNQESYCIKISLDSECLSLKKEAENLKKINDTISPIFYIYDSKKIGDKINYLITSYENAASLFELGRSYFIDNFDNFCEAYLLMQNSEKINYSLKDNIEKIYKDSNIEEYFLSDSIHAIKKYTDFNIIKKIISDIKSELVLCYDESISEDLHICHGNLNYNNIIGRNNYFKFINFEHSISSHCFYDFSKLIIELGINEKSEMELLKKFCTHLNIDFESNVETYYYYYNLSLRQKLLELIVNYLKEVYIFSSLRCEKIIKICDIFSNSYERFLSIKPFSDNKEFVIKTLTEPIMNVKA